MDNLNITICTINIATLDLVNLVHKVNNSKTTRLNDFDLDK